MLSLPKHGRVLSGLFVFISLIVLWYTLGSQSLTDLVPSSVLKKPSQPLQPTQPSPAPSAPASTEWLFDPEVHARNYGLTDSQCSTAFPSLWYEIDRAAAHRDKIGNTTPQDLDISWRGDAIVRAMIHDHQLYILEAKGVQGSHYRNRSLAILHSIHRALVAHPAPLPNIEFSFTVDDMADPGDAGATTWALSRLPEKEKLWVMGDFGYWSWTAGPLGSYEEVRRKILGEVEDRFMEKERKVVWRGAVLNEQRKKLLEVVEEKEWADVRETVWEGEGKTELMRVEDFCRYMFVVHTEGRSYSGRLKYLLNCRSVVIIPRLTWIEPYHHLLVSSGPEQNFVEVKTDFSDLEEKVQYYLDHPEKAERIANNTVKLFRDRYLTPAAQACYWRKLFCAWSRVSFEPEFYQIENETGKKVWRGVPFETYVLMEKADLP